MSKLSWESDILSVKRCFKQSSCTTLCLAKMTSHDNPYRVLYTLAMARESSEIRDLGNILMECGSASDREENNCLLRYFLFRKVQYLFPPSLTVNVTCLLLDLCQSNQNNINVELYEAYLSVTVHGQC